jgi:hypothetical protein
MLAQPLVPLTGDLRNADLTNRDLRGVDLRDAVLSGADLSGAELSGADLTGAILIDVTARSTGFGSAQLADANFRGADLTGASFSHANLAGATLQATKLNGARLYRCDLSEADLAGADLTDADLGNAALDGAVFRDSILHRARFAGATGYQSVNWIGVDVLHADLNGAHLFRRHVMDTLYLAEFKSHSALNGYIYVLWQLTSDCGRSLWRWAGLTALLATTYAAIYTLVAIDFGPNETWLSPLYFSVVTLTSLGYGDALPTSVMAQLAVMSEVVGGYVMLGGLMSILSNKMARRA